MKIFKHKYTVINTIRNKVNENIQENYACINTIRTQFNENIQVQIYRY